MIQLTDSAVSLVLVHYSSSVLLSRLDHSPLVYCGLEEQMLPSPMLFLSSVSLSINIITRLGVDRVKAWISVIISLASG